MNLNVWFEQLCRSRRSRRRHARKNQGRRYNTPLETGAPAGGPAPSAPAPTSPPNAAPSTQPAAPAVPSSVVGPGTSGLPTPGATPAAAAPAAVPGQTAAQPAAPTFDQQFRQRYGMDPAMAQTLMTLGYNQYRGQQQPAPAAQPAQPAQPKNPFGLPTFDERLLDFVVKNPTTGQLENMPGGPPDGAIKVAEYMDLAQKVQRQFWQNPAQFLGPMIEEAAAKKAEEIYKAQFGKHQNQTATEQIVQENANWLFAKGQDGQIQMQFNPATGRNEQVLSQWGELYLQSVQEIAAAGVTDPRMRHRLAENMVQNAAYAALQRQQQAPAAGNAAAQDFLNRAAAHPVQPTQQPVPVPQQEGPLDLRAMLRRNFDAGGVTDAALQTQMNGVSV